ncbi:MAG TPA: phosphatidylserine decarboxylase family protein [Desulfobacteraceae bacterium]|nr:phosphatidylserine decarboxylase family protein [Desulfobacteraceae bacterium]
MKAPRIPIAQEGYPFILFAGFSTLILAILEFAYAALPALAVTGFVLWFFRDPERVAPPHADAFVSPADGKVIVAEKITDDRFMQGEVMKISIFMNVFNVHVNRFPFGGEVKEITLRPGKFYSADTNKGALHNEYCAITVTSKNNIKYCVVQVAGLIARRIVCWAEKGDSLATGQRYGLIRFGSRVDLYLPAHFSTSVKKGDKVRAGETVLGYLGAA